MKLVSATVKNYRLHREIRIEFDAARTLIGGPNETGKSTLVEAIHRCLFLRSKGGGAPHKAMNSTIHGGHPEVELSFSVGVRQFNLRKRFSGSSGTTQLSEAGGKSLAGDEAEERLGELLGTQDPGVKLGERWAHLWVWQGISGQDPAEHAAPERTHLLQQLQQTGGAVAMQSELDGKVASLFAQAKDQIFVSSGRAKAGSDFAKSDTELQEATTLLAAATQRLTQLQQAVSDFETAEDTIKRTTSDLATLRQQQQTLNAKISEAEELQRLHTDQTKAVTLTAQKLTELQQTEDSIARLRESITNLQKSLQPRQEELAQSESRLADVRRRAIAAGSQYEDALTKTREVRLQRDLAAAYISVHEKRARNKELQERLERVSALQTEIEGFRSSQAQLPSVNEEILTQLQTLESELAQANAALGAMAAEIEVISTNQSVRVGEEALAAGGSCTVSETTDVKIGDAVCLRIHPGGGDSLGNARQQVKALRDQLQHCLDSCGLSSVAEVSRAVATRADLQGKLEGAETALKELDAAALKKTYADAVVELTEAEADVSRRQEKVQTIQPPATLVAAKNLREQLDTALQDAEAKESGCKAVLDAEQQQLANVEQSLLALRNAIVGDQHTLTGSEAQLNLLLTNHGDDAARGKALQDARDAKGNAEGSLAQTQKALQGLQPQLLEEDRKRLERAVTEADRQRQDAQTIKAVNQAAIRSDGADDPKAKLAQAKARHAAANEHLDAVKRKADAIALLDQLFHQEQQALADRFSKPLADKISSYIQCMFGAEARAVVTFEDNAFKGIQLQRSSTGSAELFDCLSGGTREQAAGAVRLAIAELLAANHNGSLPVVFDDAFAYSDPERVPEVQRMLDLGATRGLQIIVLTCNPSDYAALGARQVILSRPTRSPSAIHGLSNSQPAGAPHDTSSSVVNAQNSR